MAFRAEKKAWVFFVEAAPRVRDAGVRKLFTELRDEELGHQQLVLAEMEHTPPDLASTAVADDPVAR